MKLDYSTISASYETTEPRHYLFGYADQTAGLFHLSKDYIVQRTDGVVVEDGVARYSDEMRALAEA